MKQQHPIIVYTTNHHVFFHYQNLEDNNENEHFPLFLDVINFIEKN